MEERTRIDSRRTREKSRAKENKKLSPRRLRMSYGRLFVCLSLVFLKRNGSHDSCHFKMKKFTLTRHGRAQRGELRAISHSILILFVRYTN